MSVASDIEAGNWRPATRWEKAKAMLWDAGLIISIPVFNSVFPPIFTFFFGGFLSIFLYIPIYLFFVFFVAAMIIPWSGRSFGHVQNDLHIVYLRLGVPMGAFGYFVRGVLSIVEIPLLYFAITGDRVFDKIMGVEVIYIPPKH